MTKNFLLVVGLELFYKTKIMFGSGLDILLKTFLLDFSMDIFSK
jgi:hypothetical protein